MEKTVLCCQACGAQLTIEAETPAYIRGACPSCKQQSIFVFGRPIVRAEQALLDFVALTEKFARSNHFAVTRMLIDVAGTVQELEQAISFCDDIRYHVAHRDVPIAFASNIIQTALNYDGGFVALQQAIWNLYGLGGIKNEY